MLVENRPYVNRYGIPVLAVAIALLITRLTGALLQPTPTPLFFVAVLVSVVWCGLEAGLVAAVLSTITLNYVFLAPLYTLKLQLDDLVRLGVFALVAAWTHWLIQHRQRTQVTLQESQAQLHQITNALPVPISYVDANGYYRFNNQAYETWFGVSSHEITGQHLASILGESAYQIIEPYVAEALSGETVTYERKLSFKNGQVRYIEATYVPDVDQQGNVKGFVALINDVTERQQVAVALQDAHEQLERRVEERTAQLTTINAILQAEIQSRETLQAHLQAQAAVRQALQQQAESLALINALLAASPVGICFFDQDLRYIHINQVLAQINGLSVEQHLGQRFPDLFPEMADLFMPQLQQVLQTGEPQLNVEFCGEAPGQPGRMGCWLANYYPVRGEEGQTIGIGVMVADITESKQVEQALQVAEERLRVAITNSPITLFNQDQDLRYTWIYNPALNHQIDQVLGKRDQDLLPHDDALVITRIKQQVLETGVGTRAEVKITQQGRDLYYDLTVEPQRDEASSIIGVTCAAFDISDRKHAELALQRSEERYRAFIKQSTEGIWRFELEQPLPIATPEDEQIEHFYTFAYMAECNQVMAAMYGFERVEDLIGHRLGDLLVRSDPQNEEYLRAFIRSSYRLSDAHSCEVDRFSNFKYFSNNLVGIVENGCLVRAWGNQRDITERKQTEEALHFLAQTSSILSASLDYAATLQRVAQLPVSHMADFCSVEMLQDNNSIQQVAVAFADPSQAELATQLRRYWPQSPNPIAQVLHTGEAALLPDLSDSLFVASSDDAQPLQIGREFRLKSAIIVPLVARQRILGALTLVTAQSSHRYTTQDLAVAEDLAHRAALAIDNARLYHEATTSRHNAELAANRTARLQAVTAAFSEALTPTQVAEVVVNQGIAALGAMAGSVVLLNQEETHLNLVATVGYPEGLFDDWHCRPGVSATPLADTVERGEAIFLENVDAFVQHYPNLAELPVITGSRAFAGIPLTVEGRTVGGLELCFAQAQAFGEQDRAFMLALGQQCAQAIARAYLYEAEQAARSQAEVANRIKDEFLAVLSHELRTPLNPILGWAKLLRTRKLDQVKTAHALETIERNAQLQTQLIEDLLDISRILRGKLSLKSGVVDLVSVIEAARETVRLAAEAKSIAIRTVLNPNVGLVSGDANRLQQVVWNLLSNAVKFTPAGGWVEIKLERVGTDAQISIQDTGKGIHSDFLPHVFDYFRQEDSSTTRMFGGLGLGLAIVRQLVELHGGIVHASSLGVGQGATFTVVLPLLQDVPLKIENLVLPSDEPNLAGVQVLVVDDEKDTLDLIVVILEQWGASVNAVTSAQEALVTLASWHPDIVVSDIGMPQMDGYELIRQMQLLPIQQGPDIPVIALTAYAGEADHQQILAAGFKQHLTKPVDPRELAVAIAICVGRG